MGEGGGANDSKRNAVAQWRRCTRGKAQATHCVVLYSTLGRARKFNSILVTTMLFLYWSKIPTPARYGATK